jgi:outer membrane protein TolC
MDINLKQSYRKFFTVACTTLLIIGLNSPVRAEDLKLQGLINQAIQANPEIQAAQAGLSAAKFKIPQAKALPDPQITAGYQNNSFDKFDLGDAELAYIIAGVSQTFPFYGKRQLKASIEAHEVMGLEAKLCGLKLKTASRVKELYYELFLAYKNLDIIESKTDLFTRMENAALSRYSTGLAQQQDVLLAQTEKYNLLAQKELWKQKIQSTESSLNALLGRDANCPIVKPDEPAFTTIPYSLEQLSQIAYGQSPELVAREKTVERENLRVKLAKKEAYPDLTLTGGVYPRGGSFPAMWMVSTTFNLPVYYYQKQKNVIREAEAINTEMKYNFDATKIDISSSIRDNYSTASASEKIMKIYNNGLISRAVQSFESALTGYATGKNDALTAITPLRNLVDYEQLYWEQFVIREKSIARLEALVGVADVSAGGSKK